MFDRKIPVCYYYKEKQVSFPKFIIILKLLSYFESSFISQTYLFRKPFFI